MIYTHASKKDLFKIESPPDIAVKSIVESDNRIKNCVYP
jgi:hypothetical protein